ncbi:unnamed protein product [Wickerhamomyces anomalus]
MPSRRYNDIFLKPARYLCIAYVMSKQGTQTSPEANTSDSRPSQANGTYNQFLNDVSINRGGSSNNKCTNHKQKTQVIPFTKPESLIGSNSQPSRVQNLRVLSENEDNRIIDSSCDFKDSISTQALLDKEPDTVVIKEDIPVTERNEDESIRLSTAESSAPFKNLKLPDGESPWLSRVKDPFNDSETPWLNKIRDPFKETPINEKVLDAMGETPNSTRKVLVNSLNTPSAAHKIFQKLREKGNQKELDFDSQTVRYYITRITNYAQFINTQHFTSTIRRIKNPLIKTSQKNKANPRVTAIENNISASHAASTSENTPNSTTSEENFSTNGVQQAALSAQNENFSSSTETDHETNGSNQNRTFFPPPGLPQPNSAPLFPPGLSAPSSLPPGLSNNTQHGTNSTTSNTNAATNVLNSMDPQTLAQLLQLLQTVQQPLQQQNHVSDQVQFNDIMMNFEQTTINNMKIMFNLPAFEEFKLKDDKVNDSPINIITTLKDKCFKQIPNGFSQAWYYCLVNKLPTSDTEWLNLPNPFYTPLDINTIKNYIQLHMKLSTSISLPPYHQP